VFIIKQRKLRLDDQSGQIRVAEGAILQQMKPQLRSMSAVYSDFCCCARHVPPPGAADRVQIRRPIRRLPNKKAGSCEAAGFSRVNGEGRRD